MTDNATRPLIKIDGLDQRQQQSLLFALEADPVRPADEGYGAGALGDFGASALFFVASVTVLGGILHWVSKQRDDIIVKISILKIASIEVSKKSSLPLLTEQVRSAGIRLEGDEA